MLRLSHLTSIPVMLWHSVTWASAALAGLLVLDRPEAVAVLPFGASTLLAMPLAYAAHEASHALAARAVGARIGRMQLGPLGLDFTAPSAGRHWHWSSFKDWYVELGGIDRASALRAVVAGGPLGSFALAIAALVIGWTWRGTAPSLVAVAVGTASLAAGLSSLNPFEAGCDGRRWWALGPAHPLRDRTLALQQLGECARLDLPPADWPREAIRVVVSGDNPDDGAGDDDDTAIRLFAYVAAMAADDVEAAGRLLAGIRVAPDSRYGPVVSLERAYWSAIAGDNRGALESSLADRADLPPRFYLAAGRPMPQRPVMDGMAGRGAEEAMLRVLQRRRLAA
jgi:hypothetical protein